MDKKQCYEILLNYSCNANCLFCSQGSFNKNLDASFDDITKEIYKAKKLGYTKLGLSGGEPTIRKDLVEIIKIGYKVGFRFIRIQTNGVRLVDFKYAKSLKDAGLTFCKFSITSNNSLIHDKLTRVKGSFEKSMKAIENMKKLKVRIGNNILINRYNYKKLVDIIDFLIKKGVSNFVIIYPLYIGNMFLNKDLWIDLKSCSKYFIDAIEFMKKIGFENEILFLNVSPCFLGKYYKLSIGLEAFNTVVTSPDGSKINLDTSANENKIKGNICKDCMLYEKCGGVDKNYISIFGWKGFRNIKKEIEKDKNKFDYLTDNEKCLIEILKIKDNITTEDVLKLAKNIPLCRDCKDGNNIINAAAKLVSKNIIEMKFIKGKYYFRLI